MREIKFRAWDKKWQTMWTSVVPVLLKFIADPDCEVMQYTGLKDKNGKEIYEGDILGGIWGDGWIAYCDKCKCFQFIMKVFGCSHCSGDIMWDELVDDDGKIEVIGNIYENAELIGD